MTGKPVISLTRARVMSIIYFSVTACHQGDCPAALALLKRSSAAVATNREDHARKGQAGQPGTGPDTFEISAVNPQRSTLN
jgi:hypothetical protein